MLSTRTILVCVVLVSVMLYAEGRMCQMDPATMSCTDVVPRGGPNKGVSMCSKIGKQCQLKIRRKSIQCMCGGEPDGHPLH
ncbi:hypothetical protein DPMN_023501 [Dreissena polymorpha]|uniref:Uncharacterized protein n=1 Tax=Dreissena polymorpha TaxID=45954 RepID=A0A9D4LN27_DREPO|nr:hypothetical protein DPMN_023447 [Dreissena polymorpha]KAH3860592.1 hypothetical protein DPMN_023501 [Dreissena polymorpha]